MNEREAGEQLEELLDLLDDLAEQNQTVPIIVEGNKDIAALRSLGLSGFIIKINTGKTILETCEALAESRKDVIILTDWDRKGGMLARQLKDAFESAGARPNLEFRAKLAILCKKDIKDVESLPTFLVTLKNRDANNDIIRQKIELAKDMKSKKEKRHK
jgi:5S rRNA maturation endonuclease (ribonuclease M5)